MSAIKKKINSFKSKPVVKNTFKGLGNILSELANGSGGGFSQIYQCHTSDFVGTSGKIGRDYKGDDQQRRQNNINVYNKLYNAMVGIDTEVKNGTNNYNLNDIVNFSQASCVHFVKESDLSYDSNILFSPKLFKVKEFFPEHNYAENGEPVGCFLFETINFDLPFVYLCADGTCYFITGF